MKIKKIISWNLNSIIIRKEHLLKLMKEEEPDYVLLQELRTDENKIPTIPNYYIYANCYMGGRNGVAIISKNPLEIIKKDTIGREIVAIDNDGLVIYCIYAPSGYSENSSVQHRINFIENISIFTKYHKQFLIAGDFNVAYRHNEYYPNNPYSHEETLCLQNLESIVQTTTDEKLQYLTWWNYQNFSFQKNHGLGIDKIYLSDNIQKKHYTKVLKHYRSMIRPSDHAPIILAIGT